MNTNRLILIIAISFSLLVNIPRIIFLFGNGDSPLNSFLEVSLSDTIFRLISLFGFCYVMLKLNIDWNIKWFKKYRLFKSFIISLLFISLWLILFRIFDEMLHSGLSTTLNPRFNVFVYFFVYAMLLVISRAILLNNQTKIDAVEKEKLKQQSLHNELTALKNQVNPHFLFNSLNSLSLLVREDQNAAGKFINKLSFLYRYILQSKDQDLVTLKDELKFLNSYVYLIKQRYITTFIPSIDIEDKHLHKKIPSLALQLLVENAVKHNEISEERPLKVEVFVENDFVVVKNKIQKRKEKTESTNIGLSNLYKRFKLLSNKEIIIDKNEEYFIVKLPLL